MNIVIGHPRDIEVDDHFRFRNINSSGTDVCTYEYSNFPGPELPHCCEPCVLGFVRMDFSNLVWERFLEGSADSFGIVLRSNKDKCARVWMSVGQPMNDSHDLGVHIRNANDVLRYRLHGSSLRGNFNSCRPKQEFIRKSLDALRESCAEQQVLSFSGDNFKNVSELWHEAHVHHSVRLVKNHGMDLSCDQGSFEIKLKKTSRSCDNDVDSFIQPRDLGFWADTTYQRHGTDVCMRCKTADGLIHLQCQLFRGDQDGNAWRSVLSTLKSLQ